MGIKVPSSIYRDKTGGGQTSVNNVSSRQFTAVYEARPENIAETVNRNPIYLKFYK